MSDEPTLEELREKYFGRPMTADEILAKLKEEHAGYACQDNIIAAQIAAILKRIIEDIEK